MPYQAGGPAAGHGRMQMEYTISRGESQLMSRNLPEANGKRNRCVHIDIYITIDPFPFPILNTSNTIPVTAFKRTDGEGLKVHFTSVFQEYVNIEMRALKNTPTLSFPRRRESRRS